MNGVTRHIFCVLIIGICITGVVSAVEAGPLNLSDAVETALGNNPELSAQKQAIQAREYQTQQASLYPNPEFEAEVENFGGSGKFDSTDSLEQTYELNQPILTMGKRKKRMDVAFRERDMARNRYQILLWTVKAKTRRAFYTALAAQKRLNQRRELTRLARQALDTVRARVEAGKISPIEQTKARVAHSRASIKEQQAQRDWESARQDLAEVIGQESVTFDSLSGQLEPVYKPPVLETMETMLDTTPVMESARLSVKRNEDRLELEKANRYPDVKLGGGYKRTEETDDYAYIAKLSIPLPLFDRNQGNVESAEHRIKQARQNLTKTRIALRTGLRSLHAGWQSTYEEVQSLEDDVIPSAQAAYDASLEGFEEGKFPFLDVLDAQRTLFESRIQHIDALQRYHQQKASVEELLARNLDRLNSKGE